MGQDTNRQVRLISRPEGIPEAENFRGENFGKRLIRIAAED